MDTVENGVEIEVVEVDDKLQVKTPFIRGDKGKEFLAAWRGIEGRRWNSELERNEVPVEQKAALWTLLKTYFAGKVGEGKNGKFHIPKA